MLFLVLGSVAFSAIVGINGLTERVHGLTWCLEHHLSGIFISGPNSINILEIGGDISCLILN